MAEDRFHRAAESGHADVLRQTTKKDCNSKDDVGMTPTLISASKGDMDSLRLLISRGGDPDQCDNQGYAALHFAAMNGKMNVVTFLVAYGCNIWALTNDGRNALQLAKENEHHQIVDLLDDTILEQESKNKSEVLKRRKAAIKDAEARTKKVEKQWRKTLKKEQKLESKGKGQYTLPGADEMDPPPAHQTEGRYATTKENKKTKRKKGASAYPSIYGTQRSMRNLEIQYGPATSLFDTQQQQEQQQPSHMRHDPSRFGRPTPFGNASASLEAMTNAVALRQSSNGHGEDVVDGVSTTLGKPFSEGLAKNNNKPGLNQDYIDGVGDEVSSPLELFLAVSDLSEYLGVFIEEEIDLKSLMLLNENDMQNLGLALGPRKKLLKALEDRNKALASVGKPMFDTSV